MVLILISEHASRLVWYVAAALLVPFTGRRGILTKNVQARLREAAPTYRVYCPWPTEDGEKLCQAYLGRRAEVKDDQSHHWKTCPSCQHNVCMVCEAKQSEQNGDSEDCALPQWFVDWYQQHYEDERLVDSAFMKFILR